MQQGYEAGLKDDLQQMLCRRPSEIGKQAIRLPDWRISQLAPLQSTPRDVQ
jgi:hypothetical protein